MIFQMFWNKIESVNQGQMETNTFASTFYIRNSRLDKNGKAGIYFRITVNGQRAEISIQRKTSPEKWCPTTGRIKGSNRESKEINHYMDQLESKVYEIHSKLVIKKKPFNAETIKNKLLGKGTDYKTLLAIYEEHNAQIKELIGLDYSYGAYRRHVRTKNHLAGFIQKEYNASDLYVMEVDLNFVNGFHHYLKTQKVGNQKTNAYLKEIAISCGIDKKLTFHLARHTFATTVTLSNGISIESVSKMLGHQSLKTTQIYAKVIDKKLSDDMDLLEGKYEL